MTPENKKVLKIIAISAGVILILGLLTFLIVKQAEKRRQQREAEKADGNSSEEDYTDAKTSSNASYAGGSSTSSFGGRTFSKAEIIKMQSYLFNMGAMKMNDKIVSAIRDSGGMDGKIGNGFRTAYNEALRVGIIKNLDDLYTQAMRH